MTKNGLFYHLTIPFNFQKNVKKIYLVKSARNEKYVFIPSTYRLIALLVLLRFRDFSR